jgi:SAM-dependent methyltransferase
MRPWYEEFFDRDYVAYHLEGDLWRPERTQAECDFIVQALALGPAARVLDLCCGQGRHAIELAKRGLEVTGADLSEHLLDIARKAAEEAGVTVTMVRCDMRELPWESEFDAVVNMFTAFGYFDPDEENERVLRAVRRALRPGGRLLLDLPNREVFLQLIPNGQRGWREIEGHLVLDERTWDEEGLRLRLHRIIVAPDGSRRCTGHDLREYTHGEILDMIARAGLEWERTYGDIAMADFGPESRRMLVVGRKLR